MKSLLINVFDLLASWHLIELSSESILRSAIAPIAFAVFLISSILWFIVKFGTNQRDGGGSYFGGDSGGFDRGGGGGGGDGGC